MKLGLHLSNFTYGVPAAELAAKLTEIVVGGEAAGFDRLSVMDHYFQIPHVGPVDCEMFEAYSILGYIAAKTSRLKLGVLATGVTYRNPGFLAKQLAGLDVLSCGRAWLGIGAAWFQREHEGLGFAFPPLAQRFEMLEEAIQICAQMWSDDNGPFTGKHYRLNETLCCPRPLQRPRPRILVGGSGEKKTLRLVAATAMPATSGAPTRRVPRGCWESSASTVSVRAGTTPPSRRRSSPASIRAPAASGQTTRSSGWAGSPRSACRRRW